MRNDCTHSATWAAFSSEDAAFFDFLTAKPEKVEPVKVVTEYLAEESTILAYKLLSLNADYTHEVTWIYK